VRGQVYAGGSESKLARAFFGAEEACRVADQIYRPGQIRTINDNFDLVAILKTSYGASGECFWGDVSDTCSCRDAAEACVGEDCNMLTEGQRFERCSNLIDLLHSGSGRTAAEQNEDVSFRNQAVLDCVDSSSFCDKYFCRTKVPILAILIDQRRVDGGTFDDRSFWR
jgi:hypothetical protein